MNKVNLILFCCICSMVESFEEQLSKKQIIDWYLFLDDLYRQFSGYTFQKNLSQYNVTNLEDWGKGGKRQGLKIDQHNFQQFLRIVDTNRASHLSSRTDSNDLDVSGTWLEELNTVLNSTIIQKPHISCHDDKLAIKGNLVKISDLPKPLKCSSKRPRIIEVFALDTVFIDRDLIVEGSELVLAIMAPTWSVQGKREIRLVGSEPQKFPPAASGKKRGDRGADGRPGTPGNPSGNFLGLGMVFHNGENLKIITSGSRGGNGQDGGKGAEGIWGNNAKTMYNKYNCRGSVLYLVCYGEKGKKGGNGGDGGIGGFGGLPGMATIFYLEKKSSIKLIRYKGRVGNNGRGGSGGIGGYKGNGERREFDIESRNQLFEYIVIKDYTRAPSGSNGRTGGNKRNRNSPKSPARSDTHVNSITQNYIMYLIDGLASKYSKEKVLDTLISMLKNDITKTHKITDIVNVFIKLEKDFLVLYEKVDLLRLYNEFERYIEKQAGKTKDENSLQLWNFLHTATLSKICTVESLANGKFIANLNNFLDMFLRNIEKYKEIDQEVTITNYKKNYKAEIDKEIGEANNLLDKHVTPIIRISTTATEKKIDILTKEIYEIKRLNLENRYLLQKNLKMLRKNLKQKFIAGALNRFGGNLMSYVQLGKSTIGVISTLKGDNRVKSSSEVRKMEDQMKAVESAISAEAREKIKVLKDQLNGIKSVIGEGSGVFKPVSNRLEALGKEMDSWNFYDNIASMFLNRLSEVESYAQSLVSKRSDKFLLFAKIQGVKTSADMMKSGIDMWKQFKKGQHQIKTCHEAISENEEIRQKLEVYEENIQSSMRPMLKTLRTTIDGLPGKLGGLSESRLLVIQQQIQSYLKDVMVLMQRFTKDFEVEEEFTRSINLIMDTVKTMMDIFQKIQTFQRQKKMADFLARINSVRYKSIEVKDDSVADFFTKIEVSIQTNLILLQYRQFLSQLKLFVFPLAKIYFKDYSLPFVLEQKKTMKEYLYNTINQIETFKLKITESNIYITKFDQIKRRAKFYPNTINGAFYVWHSQQHNDSIRKLLAGEEVVFQADMLNHQENAIKFSHIHLRLKAHSDQDKLDEILKNFTLSMTHTGNNYYSCNSKPYVVKTDAQKLEFSFRGYKKKPIETNFVYDKLRKGDFMLSPFTLWMFQIIDVTSGGFDLLTKFEQEVDLELVGVGEYFENDPDLCGNDLDEYYEPWNMTQKAESECLKAVTTGIGEKNSCSNLPHNQ